MHACMFVRTYVRVRCSPDLEAEGLIHLLIAPTTGASFFTSTTVTSCDLCFQHGLHTATILFNTKYFQVLDNLLKKLPQAINAM